jgi:hypothetical protein
MYSVCFFPDQRAELMYGYGQTIYAHLKCRFSVVTDTHLRFIFLPSPARQRFQGFTPEDGKDEHNVEYSLTQGRVTGVESVVAHSYTFHWMLELNRSPYPDGLDLPYAVPLTFYGHEEPRT